MTEWNSFSGNANILLKIEKLRQKNVFNIKIFGENDQYCGIMELAVGI